MKFRSIGLGVAAILSIHGEANAQALLPVTAASDRPAAVLPANTEIVLSMNEELTTKGRTWNEGDTFGMTVVQDIRIGEYVVIPRGSRGVGRISWLTNKGAFGKSGKMDIELEYVEVAGQRINIDGTYRQEGEGNTVATVAGVVVAGVLAGFVTGRSARIPRGRELTAHTEADIPLAIPDDEPTPVGPPALEVQAPEVRGQQSQERAQATLNEATTINPQRVGAITCETCRN